MNSERLAVIDWLHCHEQATEDCLRSFNKTKLEDIDTQDIVNWIYDHETLAEDFQNFFGAETATPSY